MTSGKENTSQRLEQVVDMLTRLASGELGVRLSPSDAGDQMDVVITGPSNAQQLEETLAEVAKGPMTEEELEWMRRIGDYVYGRKSG